MAPYAEAVVGQARSWPLVRAAGQLVKARHERSRTRTLERSLMHMQALAEGQNQPQPPVMTRLRSAQPPILVMLEQHAVTEDDAGTSIDKK